MSAESYQRVYLADYEPPAFLVEHVHLSFDIDDEACLVTSKLTVQRNPESPQVNAPFELSGKGLELVDIVLDGASLKESYCAGGKPFRPWHVRRRRCGCNPVRGRGLSSYDLVSGPSRCPGAIHGAPDC